MRVISRVRHANLHGNWAVVLLLVMVAGTSAGCEKVGHDNLDKWMSTEKGVGKLRKAVRGDHDPDLRAHAAHNLILHPEGLLVDVKDAMGSMSPENANAIMAKLAVRLWESAQKGLTSELQVPSNSNIEAKDALFELRDFASFDTKKVIHGYLLDWLGAYYEARSQLGRNAGRQVIREIGAEAAPRLLASARSILAQPPGESGEHLKVGDELLAGLAWSGTAEAAGFLMDLVDKDYKDDTLTKRALAALHEAYVQPLAGSALSGREALTPHAERLGQLARNESLPGVMNNDAVDLLHAAGPPACLEPFAKMAAMPAAQQAFRWVGVQRGLRCAGASGLVQLVEAMPPSVAYERALLQKYVWKEILDAPGQAKVAEQLRMLLRSSSPVARVTAVEVLGKIAESTRRAEDVAGIRALANDRAKLAGWWGPQSDVPKAERKKDPTIGQVAAEVAQRVEGLAKAPKTK